MTRRRFKAATEEWASSECRVCRAARAPRAQGRRIAMRPTNGSCELGLDRYMTVTAQIDSARPARANDACTHRQTPECLPRLLCMHIACERCDNRGTGGTSRGLVQGATSNSGAAQTFTTPAAHRNAAPSNKPQTTTGMCACKIALAAALHSIQAGHCRLFWRTCVA